MSEPPVAKEEQDEKQLQKTQMEEKVWEQQQQQQQQVGCCLPLASLCGGRRAPAATAVACPAQPLQANYSLRLELSSDGNLRLKVQLSGVTHDGKPTTTHWVEAAAPSGAPVEVQTTAVALETLRSLHLRVLCSQQQQQEGDDEENVEMEPWLLQQARVVVTPLSKGEEGSWA